MEIFELKNFLEENNNIPYLSWIVRIWDFKLYKNDNEKIIGDAKVWYTAYWIKSLEELKNTNKKIIVVIPALTWNSKIFDTIASQWSGWANTYWTPWNILDPKNNLIIWLDYFWWPYDSSWPDKHNLDFYPVPPIKQTEAWKKALKKLWIKKIHTLFWGSNWWWHIHNWIFDLQYTPEFLISVAWPIAPDKKTKDFFSLQLDFIQKKEDVSERLKKNLENLKWQSILYDELIKESKKEIKEALLNWDHKKIIKIVRQIWFLKFLNPLFFDKFHKDKHWNDLKNIEEAIQNMLNYFKKEWENFEKRFWLSSLALLIQWIVDAEKYNPKDYVEQISQKINLIIVWIEDDNLFKSDITKAYFKEVAKQRKKRWDEWKTDIIIIESDEKTKQAWHDSFLWPEIISKISSKIKNTF